MKKYRAIIEDTTPPKDKYCLWMDNGTLKSYKDGKWTAVNAGSNNNTGGNTDSSAGTDTNDGMDSDAWYFTCLDITKEDGSTTYDIQDTEEQVKHNSLVKNPKNVKIILENVEFNFLVSTYIFNENIQVILGFGIIPDNDHIYDLAIFIFEENSSHKLIDVTRYLELLQIMK